MSEVWYTDGKGLFELVRSFPSHYMIINGHQATTKELKQLNKYGEYNKKSRPNHT